jgi:thiol-disulfide isomerase/thioredoxin
VEINSILIWAGLLLAIATAIGIVFRVFSGRGHSVKTSECIDLGKLKANKNGLPVTEFGKKATLVQFSTEYCGQCPGVRRSLSQLEYRHGSLLYLDVDITDRLDLAAHFSISQTPTVFILDELGRIKFRIGGVPKPNVIQAELEKLGAL